MWNPDDVEVEDVWVAVQYLKLPSFIIGTVYRHSHIRNNSYDYLLNVFKDMCLGNKSLFILGDLKDNLMSENAKLGQVINNVKMKRLINKPTIVTELTASLLDIIITNKPEMVTHSDVFPCEIADHDLLSDEINPPQKKN